LSAVAVRVLADTRESTEAVRLRAFLPGPAMITSGGVSARRMPAP
jgi:hypothetical protein